MVDANDEARLAEIRARHESLAFYWEWPEDAQNDIGYLLDQNRALQERVEALGAQCLELARES